MTSRKRGRKANKEPDAPSKETFASLSVEGKTPATAVLLLNSSEEEILIKACEAVHTFAEKGDENKVYLLGLGALDPLCRLITHHNDLIRRKAFVALGTMATKGDVRNTLKKLDVIPSLIDSLSLEDVVVHEFATLCLALLSVDFNCKVKIFDRKGLPALIQLLFSLDPDVKKNSLECIYNLVQDYESRQAAHALGVIPPLLELLKSDFPVIQHLALKTLQNITTDEETRNTFREEKGFEKLMDILSNAELSDLHVEALEVVANCLIDSESIQLLHSSAGLTRLMTFILTSTKSEIHLNAVKCITRVAQSSENRKLLHEQNVEKVLVDLLSPGEVDVKIATCKAVHTMSLCRASTDCIRDLGGISEVVKLLNTDSLLLKEAATLALSTLTHTNQLNAFAVFEAAGHKKLVRMLCAECPRTVANCAAALCNMAGQEVIRSGILAQGAVQALVEPLKSTNTQVLVNTMQCLVALTCVSEARMQLRGAGGLQPLVNLLRSYNKEILHNACLAISACANDQPAAAEMYQFGALEMLLEINQSENRRSSFSKLAMNTLLNSNLPVKYGLTGHLNSTDSISDGFYDVGKIKAGEKILTLEELSKQAVNNLRPIIVVNTDTEKKSKDDFILQCLLKEVKESVVSLTDEEEQYAALARLVSDAMGGEVEMEKLHEFPWLLHLSELKVELQSNVIPIGLIRKGFYCHRALLFKCLADCVGMSCKLVRGDYNRAWNEVLLFKENGPGTVNFSQPSCYIVDLMHQPGRLLPVNTPAAVQYQTI